MARARDLLRQAVQRLRDVDPGAWGKVGQNGKWVKLVTAECLRLAACSAEATGDPKRAVRVLGAADGLREASTWGLLDAERARHDRDAGWLREPLSGQAFDSARDAGRSLSVAEALAEALRLIDGATTAL